MDTKKMMRLITPTLLERSSKQLDKETDWDLLAEMDAEEEGQPVPMQEIVRRQAEAKVKGPSHSKAPQLQIRMGSPNTLLKK